MRRAAFTGWFLIVGLLAASGLAVQVEVVTEGKAGRIEIRRILVEGRDPQTLYVITGDRVVVTIGDMVIEGTEIQFNVDTGVITIVGPGRFDDGTGQSVTGTDMVIELDAGAYSARDVVIVTDQIDLVGAFAERLPGQIQVADGFFSPCTRCLDQPVPDYAFRAERIFVYPGDRLVAENVTLLVAGEPVLTIPLMVILLGPPDRQPRLEIGAGEDGFFLVVDLPYYFDPESFGFFLLRYYQTRGWGFGFDHRWFDEGADGRIRVLVLPALAADPLKRTLLQLAARLNAALEPGVNFELELARDDLAGPEELRRTMLLRSRVESIRPPFRVTGLLHGRVDFDSATPLPRGEIVRAPQVTVALDPQRVGPFTFSAGLDAGAFAGPSNPLNRRAAAQGPRVTTLRVVESHAASFAPPATAFGLLARAENRFTGRTFATGERHVTWISTAAVTQRVAGLGMIEAAWSRTAIEGESPFAGALGEASARLAESLRVGGSLRPIPEFSLTGLATYDLARRLAGHLVLTPSIQPLPGLALTGTYIKDLQTGQDLRVSGSLEYSSPSFSASLRSGYRFDAGRFDEGELRSTLVAPDRRTHLTFGYRWDPNDGRSNATEFTGALPLGPVSLTLSRLLYDHRAYTLHLDVVATAPGPVRLAFRSVTRYPGAPGTGLLPAGDTSFSLSASAFLRAFEATLTGTYLAHENRVRGPTLALASTIAEPWFEVSLRAAVALPELAQPAGLRRADLGFGLDLTAGVSVQGRILYERTVAGGIESERLTLRDTGVTFAFGRGLYLSALVSQSWAWHPPALPHTILKPRFVLTLDRCCWAVQFTFDALREEFRVAFTLPGAAQGFALEVADGAIRFPGGLGTRWPR